MFANIWKDPKTTVLGVVAAGATLAHTFGWITDVNAVVVAFGSVITALGFFSNTKTES